MKYLSIAILTIALSACSVETQTWEYDTTLSCETPREDGTTAKREIRHTATYEYPLNPNMRWVFRDGAWVFTTMNYEGGAVFRSVTPFLGESCNPYNN